MQTTQTARVRRHAARPVRQGVVVLALTVLAAACLPTGAASAADKLDLKLRLKKGDFYRLGMTIDQTISQTPPGQAQPQEMKQQIGMGYTMEVQDVDGEGAATLKTVYDTIKFSQKGAGGNVEFDSSNPPADIPPMARGFAAIAGQTFTMVITPDGKVKEVRGVDEMLDAVVKKLDLPPGPNSEMMSKMLKQQFGETAMKEQMQNLFGFYPAQPVAVGDSWTQNVKVTMGFPMVLDNTYTLKERKDGVAHIAVESKMTPNADAKPLELGQMTMKYSLSGTQSGVTQVEEKTGWSIGGKMNQDFKGDIEMKFGENAMKMPMAIKSGVVLTSSKDGDAKPAK